MAEAKEAKKAQPADQDQSADDEAVQATSRQYTGSATPDQPATLRQMVEQNLASAAKNPVDFAGETGEVDVDELPPVPPAGMFMAAEDQTEDLAPGPEAAGQEGGQEGGRRAESGQQKSSAKG